MWDSHVRVGGAKGTDLDFATCPKLSGLNDNCLCAALLFHVTKQASGYFENVWIWLADQYVPATNSLAQPATAANVSQRQ